VCVVSGLLPDPLAILRDESPPSKPQRHAMRAPVRVHAAPTRTVVAHAIPTATATPVARHRARLAATDPAQVTTRTSHEKAPISPAPASSAGTEPFTPQAVQVRSEPAAAPATGGGEFTP
jgi:hypothetical protein